MEQTRHFGDSECLRSIMLRLERTDRELVTMRQLIRRLETKIAVYESKIAAVQRFVHDNGLLDGLTTRKSAELLRLVRTTKEADAYDSARTF